MVAEIRQSEELYRWIPQSCPICEIPPETRLGRRGGDAHNHHLGVACEIWRCGKCGLLFPNPMPVPVHGLDQHYAMNADQYFHHHDRHEKELAGARMVGDAERTLGRKGRLLDIGAGRGELLLSATRAGWNAVGIEPSSTFAEYAENYSGAEIRRETLEHCSFTAASFDVVILSGVLEHLYNPSETIGEISRILRKGGILFLDVPNEEGLYFKLGNLYQRLRGRDWVMNLAPTFEPFHVFGFGPGSLKAMLSKHGFKPTMWHVYAGVSLVPCDPGLIPHIERYAAKAITAISNIGQMGTYIETWAVKK